MAFKIGIICGHGDEDPGVCALGYREADLVRQLAPYVKKHLDSYASVEILDTNRDWYKFFKNGGFYDFKRFDYVIELHCNAGVHDPNGNGATTGIEIWVTPREEVTLSEQLICKHVSTLGMKNRGVKRANFLVINCVKDDGVSSCLIETGFIGDRDDMNILTGNMDLFASKIALGVIEAYGLKGTPVQPTPTPQPQPSPQMSASQFAKEVWFEGKHGTGATREQNAKRLGVNYAEAQRLIDILAKGGKIDGVQQEPSINARQFAMEVWFEGKHGNGKDRKYNAERLGVDYNEAQRLIDILAKGGKI